MVSIVFAPVSYTLVVTNETINPFQLWLYGKKCLKKCGFLVVKFNLDFTTFFRQKTLLFKIYVIISKKRINYIFLKIS